MSSSYRSIRFGLSHWDPYSVHRGGCLVVLLKHGGVVLVRFKPDLDDQMVSFSALTLLVGHVACKIVPEMTYNVLSGKVTSAAAAVDIDNNNMFCEKIKFCQQ